MIQRFDVGARLSEMAIHNGVIYLAGQVAEDATQGIAGQTQQVLAEIDALLARAGSAPRVSTTSIPAARRRSARYSRLVLLPAPSGPSRVINKPVTGSP